MSLAKTTFVALALVACLGGTSAFAGNADDARSLIVGLLNFDRPDHPEVQAAATTVDGCQFRVATTFSDSDAALTGTIWGDLRDITSAQISRQPGDPIETLQFQLPQQFPNWGGQFEGEPHHPLFQQLTDTPSNVDFLVGECSESACFGTVILPDDWDYYDYTFGLTDLVTDAEADQLLAAFQNLADLCDAQAQ